MAGAGERIGMEQIKQAYNMYASCPYYALFEGTTTGRKGPGRLIYAYKENDRNGEGWNLLQQNLQVVQSTDPEALFFLQFYDELGKGGRLDASTPYSGSFPLRMKEKSYTPAISGVQPLQDNNFLAYLQNQLLQKEQEILELRDTVDELEAELEQLQKEPGEKIEGVIGQIGEAGVQFPWLADLIKDWSTVLKHKLTSRPGQQQYRPAGAAGIAGVDTAAMPYQEKLKRAQQTLMQWYAKEYGDLETEEGRLKGAQQFANDLLLLSQITADDDMMHLALKKLRAMA